MKHLNHATLLLTECLVLALLLSGCGESTAQAPATSPEPSAAMSAPGSEAEPPADSAAGAEASRPAGSEERGAARTATATAVRASSTPTTSSASGLTVRRLVVARDVEAREPVGADTRFNLNGEPLYAFLEMASTSTDAQEILVTFEHEDGTSVGHVELEIPSNVPRWRTWALSHNVTRAGEWRAVVRTAEGEIIGEATFEAI
jgi:hypothetical protein